MSEAPYDILLILAPPPDFCSWVERVLEAKQAKGETPPQRWLDWLERWDKMRSHIVMSSDVLTNEEWQELGEVIP